ncbi:MAG: hypothetical protein LUO85_03835, partial [Methanomassiliicoccales archaeon]|nr:hypothetical protein [Methanomassiliicoccales archaeon]
MAPEVSDIFARMESSKKGYLNTKTSDEAEKFGPHLVMLPDGAVPDYVKLTKYQEFCWRTIGKMARLRAKPNPKLELSLLQAHMRMRPEEFVAYVWMTTIIVLIIAAVVAFTMGGLFIALLGIDAASVLIFMILIIVLPPILVYVVLNSTPGSKAKKRGRDMDKRIGPSMSFISAMASADVNVDVIFKELSRQKIYGEIASEAEWITRDTELLGIDILTAVS